MNDLTSTSLSLDGSVSLHVDNSTVLISQESLYTGTLNNVSDYISDRFSSNCLNKFNQILSAINDENVNQNLKYDIMRGLNSILAEISQNREESNISDYLDYLLTRALNHVDHVIKEYDNDIKDCNDLLFTVGLEMTYHIPEDTSFCLDLTVTKYFSNILTDTHRIYIDQGLLEICTTPKKNRKDLFEEYEKIDTLLKEHGFKPYIKNKGGGGLHINIGINKSHSKSGLLYFNLVNLISNYPELNWVFNEPSDNKTANNLQLSYLYITNYNMLYHKSDIELLDITTMNTSKTYSMVLNKDYIELRFFEMSRDLNEFKDYLDLVEGLYSISNTLAKENVKCPLIRHKHMYLNDSLYFFEKEYTAEEDFYNLLSVLKLNKNRYKKYIKRNLNVRIEKYGKTYLC